MSIKKLNETHPQIADFLLNKSEACMLSHAMQETHGFIVGCYPGTPRDGQSGG